MMKRAIITGITGQDGVYLAEFLLEKGYFIYGLIRDSNRDIGKYIPENILQNNNFELIEGDLASQKDINSAVEFSEPHEFYNLGAQTFVPKSWEDPSGTFDITGMGTLRCLEAIRIYCPECKFFQAGSSEIFGKPKEEPQTENTFSLPITPYGNAKFFAQSITDYYREIHSIFACTGILFSHESPRRGENFVTRKVTLSVAKIKLNMLNVIQIGNIDSRRDWGYSKDFVKAMWMMLQQETPQNMIISTGKSHSVKQLLEVSFEEIGIYLEWSGYGKDAIAHDQNKVLRVSIDEKYYRDDAHDICVRGSYKLAEKILGWRPEVEFEDMIKKMVREDINKLK